MLLHLQDHVASSTGTCCFIYRIMLLHLQDHVASSTGSCCFNYRIMHPSWLFDPEDEGFTGFQSAGNSSTADMM